MLRTIGNTCGGVMAMLCLTSTLALAQSQSPSWHYTTPPQIKAQAQQQVQGFAQAPSQSRYMTCTVNDRHGNCTAGVGTDGQVIAVIGENIQTGDHMTCVSVGNVMHCTLMR